MEKDIFDTLKEPNLLLNNEYYFKYIFKKTEKIVCAVFYILSVLKNKEKDKELLRAVEARALGVLERAGKTLSVREEEAPRSARPLAEEFVMLESELRVLAAAGYLSTEHLDVLLAEIDAVLRTIRGFRTQQTARQTATRSVAQRTEKRARTTPRVLPKESTLPQSERRDQIIAVLKAQPGASIKDVTDTIKDYSDKTIQRDLNSMIEEGVVMREGEKRWSKYSLI